MKKIALLLALAGCAAAVSAQEKVVNIYSSRHYQTDEALYSGFTKQTGIKINRIEAGEDALIERIRNEGARSPADVLITVDAGRLWRAEQLGLFQPVSSKVLESRIPSCLVHFFTPRPPFFGISPLRSGEPTWDDCVRAFVPGRIVSPPARARTWSTVASRSRSMAPCASSMSSRASPA